MRIVSIHFRKSEIRSDQHERDDHACDDRKVKRESVALDVNIARSRPSPSLESHGHPSPTISSAAPRMIRSAAWRYFAPRRFAALFRVTTAARGGLAAGALALVDRGASRDFTFALAAAALPRAIGVLGSAALVPSASRATFLDRRTRFGALTCRLRVQ
jgi:hypothetical protein